MATLTCSAQNCVHNLNALCTANTIHVDNPKAHASKDTECNTFAEKGLGNAIANMGNMNLIGEVKQVFTNSSIEMSPKIGCKAVNCYYNHDQICTASNVQIYGPNALSSKQTQCETFVEV